MKSHIGSNGPSRCTAQPGNCPFGDSDNHFNTITEARQAYTARLENAYATVTVVKKKLSEKEKSIRSENAKLAQNLVQARSESFKGITFDDANPERAKRRLNEAIEFANSRYNENLVSKLAKATVLPSGAFKLENGTRVNTDGILQKALVIKTVEKERERMLEALSEVAKQGGNEKDKYQVRTDRGLFSVSIGKGFDEKGFEKLSKAQREACMSPKESLNIDLARENLSPAKLRQITSESQVLDYVYGKEPDIGQKELVGNTKFTGKTTDEKMQDGTQSIANFYGKVVEKHGYVRDLKKYTSEGGEAIKVATSESKTNTFVPARSQYNGAIVSGRVNLNPKLAKELLTPEELESITVIKESPDPQKAKTVLSEADFGRIFEARKATLRVTEAKD